MGNNHRSDDDFRYLVKRIGTTTYKVKVGFSKNDAEKETMEDKILRIIRNLPDTNGKECGIMNTPQMSRPA
ncbi:MAG: hypothetical protein GXZ14_03695 [Ruminococcaceae bacterium]|nr:hypothetical protein [Oscillospiraceae bacterium]